jgi:hypothetical protein
MGLPQSTKTAAGKIEVHNMIILDSDSMKFRDHTQLAGMPARRMSGPLLLSLSRIPNSSQTRARLARKWVGQRIYGTWPQD